MSVTSIDKDFDSLSLTPGRRLPRPGRAGVAAVGRPPAAGTLVGPPTYPATVEQHDLIPGGAVTYFMTSPEGEKYCGWWRITSVNPSKSLEFTDGFANQDGTPNAEMPTTTVRMQLTEHDSGTRMELRSAFNSREEMEQLANMGMVEGLRQSVGQMDALLAD